MKLIDQNPFRTLGIDGSASLREIQNQIKIIKRYAEIGQKKSFPLDLEFLLGIIQRDPEAVNRAASEIEQALNKVINTLSWYYKSSTIDETALNHLSNGDIDKAEEIWLKVTDNKEVTTNNMASFLNLSTLWIEIGFTRANSQLLIKGIQLKGKLFSSALFIQLIQKIAGENMLLNSDKVIGDFSKALIKELKNKGFGIDGTFIRSAFSNFPSTAVKDILKDFTETPRIEIEKAIQRSVENREDDPGEANESGRELYRFAKPLLTQLKESLGESHIQVTAISNDLAGEILQCAIDYFNDHYDDSDFDPGEEAVAVTKLAKSLGATGAMRKRIDEESTKMEEWVRDAPQRRTQKLAGKDLVFVTIKLKEFENKSNNTANADNLITECQAPLNRIKTTLGATNQLYLGVSSAVANHALGMLIEVVNSAQNNPVYRLDPSGLYTVITQAQRVMTRIRMMDMVGEMRTRFNENDRAINSIQSQLSSLINRIQYAQTRTTSSRSSGGCYIATMAYGSYDHPQVLILRKFRDEILAQSLTGRLFIKIYYFLSPKLVKLLSGHKSINKGIRNILDQIVNQLNS
ncbi:MAG: hypothetical protein KBC43_03125 [Bacteroidales bacterium]|nr:hypothetical protein [Bacteroidales bacterium]